MIEMENKTIKRIQDALAERATVKPLSFFDSKTLWNISRQTKMAEIEYAFIIL